jgi:hypothetical protein
MSSVKTHDKTHNDLADAPSHVVVHFTALPSASKPSIASSFPRCPTWYLPNLLNRLEALARSKSAAVARPLRDHDAGGAVVHACPTLKRYKESKKAWGFHADMPNKLFLVLQCGKLQHQTITSRKHKAKGANVDIYRTLHPTFYTCTTPIFSAQRSNHLRRLQYIKPLLQSSPPPTASSVFVPSAFNHTNSSNTMSTVVPFSDTLTRAAWPVPYTPRSLTGPSPEAMDRYGLRSAKAVSERLGTRRPDRTTAAYLEKKNFRAAADKTVGCVCAWGALVCMYILYDSQPASHVRRGLMLFSNHPTGCFGAVKAELTIASFTFRLPVLNLYVSC